MLSKYDGSKLVHCQPMLSDDEEHVPIFEAAS